MWLEKNLFNENDSYIYFFFRVEAKISLFLERERPGGGLSLLADF